MGVFDLVCGVLLFGSYWKVFVFVGIVYNCFMLWIVIVWFGEESSDVGLLNGFDVRGGWLEWGGKVWSVRVVGGLGVDV